MPATWPSRYALAEIVLIRGASVFEDALAGIAYRLACGAQFPSGATDDIILRSSSLAGARLSMRMEGGARATPKDFLKWTKSKNISESVKGVIAPTSHYITTCQKFGSQIAELFDVRHHAAHKNSNSREKYQNWVRAQYGHKRNIPLGYFLLTKNLSPIPNIERYLSIVRVIVNDLVEGP